MKKFHLRLRLLLPAILLTGILTTGCRGPSKAVPQDYAAHRVVTTWNTPPNSLECEFTVSQPDYLEADTLLCKLSVADPDGTLPPSFTVPVTPDSFVTVFLMHTLLPEEKFRQVIPDFPGGELEFSGTGMICRLKAVPVDADHCRIELALLTKQITNETADTVYENISVAEKVFPSLKLGEPVKFSFEPE